MTAEQKLLLDTLATEADLVVTYIGHIPVQDASVEYVKQAMTHAERVRDALRDLVAKSKESPFA